MKNIKKYLALGIVVAMCMNTGCGKTAQQSNGTGNVYSVNNVEKVDSLSDNTTGKSQSGTNTTGSNGVISNGNINTGNLTENAKTYQGEKSTGKYNYGEALQKSLLFYELQRSGDLPEEVRCNWRGDSALKDGSDAGLDLTGGWYDAGDNVKFNLPMSYSAAMLGWSLIEDVKAYADSEQLEYARANVKWANDYFIKCHPKEDVYYYQVGNGSSDHTFWGPAEVVELRMDRPSYCVTKDKPGSTVTGETAASLAICSLVFKEVDYKYSEECLNHAKSLYKFAKDTKSDAGYTAAAGFYDSHSGFYDELSFAAAWLYMATDDKSYLEDSKEFYKSACQDYDWAVCWDDVHIAAALLLAQITKEDTYKKAVEEHLDYWTDGNSEGRRITYTPKGLAWLDNWGSLRYASTTAFIAAMYSEKDICSKEKTSKYWDFAVSQANYILGETGFSYLIGYGDKYPVNPHHRTAQGSYADNMNTPSTARHILYGALVGGPDASDGYKDEVSNYNNNEVACDYNAGFTGLMAKLYSKYKGETLKDFGAVEEVTDKEFFVEAGVNVSGEDFVEIRAYVHNESAWPARAAKNLELRYFVDLTEIVNAGGSPSDIKITNNYMQAGKTDGLKIYDEANNIYYLSVLFEDGSIYPGGQEHYKKEIQVRMCSTGKKWDNSNDPSYVGLSSGSVVMAEGIALYEDGKLIYGSEPKAGANAGTPVEASDKKDSDKKENETQISKETEKETTKPSNVVTSLENGQLSVAVKYDNSSAEVNSIAGSLEIGNLAEGEVDLSKLAIYYYFTSDNDSKLNFACYHAAVNGANGYKAVGKTTGKITECKKTDADNVCEITFGDKVVIGNKDALTVNFCINHSDWSNFNTANDYSGKTVENIVVKYNNKIIFGVEP